MTDFVTLTCPSCGGQLDITTDIERFACSHCGNEHLVRRSGGTVSILAVEQKIDQIEKSSSRTADELALSRLKNELDDIVRDLDEFSPETNKKNFMIVFGYLKKGLESLGKLPKKSLGLYKNKSIIEAIDSCDVNELDELFDLAFPKGNKGGRSGIINNFIELKKRQILTISNINELEGKLT